MIIVLPVVINMEQQKNTDYQKAYDAKMYSTEATFPVLKKAHFFIIT